MVQLVSFITSKNGEWVTNPQQDVMQDDPLTRCYVE